LQGAYDSLYADLSPPVPIKGARLRKLKRRIRGLSAEVGRKVLRRRKFSSGVQYAGHGSLFAKPKALGRTNSPKGRDREFEILPAKRLFVAGS
jgi:hypothetical protein